MGADDETQPSTPANPRRLVPRTDELLADSRLRAASERVGYATVKQAVRDAQARARVGELDPQQVADAALAALPEHATSLHPVINATGVVLHTNLGRSSLSDAAIEAMQVAARYVDVEFDLASGQRARRGRGTLDAIRAAVPAAGDVLVVNNGAAALALVAAELASSREVVVSRGELIEIGDGFRLPDLIAATGAQLREVGTTNRTALRDYAAAMGPQTGCILKVHPSNFVIEGFTSAASVRELASLEAPVVVDVGSGLLTPHPLLPDEPDVTTCLKDGATLVTCSGDKLLGGPQAGLIFGAQATIERLRRHPLARALRVDKLTLAALEATLRGPLPPTAQYLNADQVRLKKRAQSLAAKVGAEVVASDGVVGGGGGPGVTLPGWAISLPAYYAEALRQGNPPVVGRLEHGRCLLDLRCVPEDDEEPLLRAIRAAQRPCT